MAEFYHIYNYREIKGRNLAIFVCGLRPFSRLMVALSGCPVTQDQIIQASILDRVNFLAWAQTKDGAKGINKPKSIVDLLMNREENQSSCVFDSAEDFEKARAQIIKELK